MRPIAGERDASAELAFLLERAGIALPAERMADVAAEYESFRQQLALVNGAYAAEDEPALIFAAQPKSGGVSPLVRVAPKTSGVPPPVQVASQTFGK